MKITPKIRFWIVFGIALFIMMIFWVFFVGLALIATVIIIILGISIWIWSLVKKTIM